MEEQDFSRSLCGRSAVGLSGVNWSFTGWNEKTLCVQVVAESRFLHRASFLDFLSSRAVTWHDTRRSEPTLWSKTYLQFVESSLRHGGMPTHRPSRRFFMRTKSLAVCDETLHKTSVLVECRGSGSCLSKANLKICGSRCARAVQLPFQFLNMVCLW